MQAQWSPVFSFLTGDFNNDHQTDILSAGNFYGVLPYEGRYDASFGTVLLSDGKHSFATINSLQSGFMADGEVRDIKCIRSVNGRQLFVVARNNGAISLFALVKPG